MFLPESQTRQDRTDILLIVGSPANGHGLTKLRRLPLQSRKRKVARFHERGRGSEITGGFVCTGLQTPREPGRRRDLVTSIVGYLTWYSRAPAVSSWCEIHMDQPR